MNLWMLQLRHVSAGHIAYNARDKNTEGDKLGYDHGFGDMWARAGARLLPKG